MTANSGLVDFRLFSLSRTGSGKEQAFLSPQGTIILQRVGFPRDFDDCTCIPKGPVMIWSHILGYQPFEAQWYQPAHNIERIDIPAVVTETIDVKEYLCHQRRPDLNVYPITSLSIDNQEVQSVGFIGKRLAYFRLGHRVELDLTELDDGQTFTLAVEWDVNYIELRVTWLEGLGVDTHCTGYGLTEFEDLENYQPPSNATIVRHTRRSDFDAALASSPLSNESVRTQILDTTSSGKDALHLKFREDKTPSQKDIHDFLASRDILSANIDMFHSGKRELYRVISVELRKLTCDGKSTLFPRIIGNVKFHPVRGKFRNAIFRLPAIIEFDGKGGSRILALFETRAENISLEEWLSQPLFNDSITIRELIRSVADKVSAHSDENYSDTLLFTKSVKIVDEDLHNQYIVAIGEYILNIMEEIIRQYPREFSLK